MTIGGIVDYNRLAQLHRPTDDAVLASEVRRLAASGLTAMDIAVALRLSLPAVREMIAVSGNEATDIQRQAWSR